jgi:integrase
MTAVPYLMPDERDRLLTAYNRWAQPAVIVLAYQGCRTQEALQLDWRNISWLRRTLYFSRTKNTRPRTVPMHRRVRVTLYLIWRRQGRPKSGPVFLSHRGEPYSDTRGIGGNPLRKAHETACRAAGISSFRVHDWRHSWAAHMVMSGCDMITLMRLGGWKTMSMVARYAAVSTDHMAEAVARLA